MSDFKSVMKGGWHPKGKDGGKESWRGDFKGINQVAGWMGKGKDTSQSAQQEHIARPLASLKDPSLFGPPPKNVNYHGGAALPNEITPHRGGLGAPLTKEEISSAREAVEAPAVEEQEQSKPAPPPLPYRADRTGLRTDNLPAPPVHKELRDVSPAPVSQGTRPTPGLPPRLPSRQNTVEAPPPPYEPAGSSVPATSSTPLLNQSAINRLGKAGVSVPGFGIGNSNESAATPSTETKSWRGARSQFTAPSSGLSELQSRFAKMNTSNTSTDQTAAASSAPEAASPQTQTPPPAAAPTWQQTRSALTTANSAYKDPSSVSLADAQQAAATAQNAQRSAAAFRDRHGETINAAQTRATQLNKKYNMTGRLNKFLEDANNAHDEQQQQQQQTPTAQQQIPVQPQQPVTATASIPSSPPPPTTTSTTITPTSTTPQISELAASISRKPPPPPPPKKPASMQAPPPVPLGTRPNFS